MPALTPEVKARALAAVEAAKQRGTFSEMEKMSSSDQAKWENEVAMLQMRVYTAHQDVDIGGGDTIAVRTSLLDSEVSRLEELERKKAVETDPEAQAAISCEMLEIITANPLITKDWLLNNREMYSPSDLLSILLGYMEVRLREKADMIARLQSAVSFRKVRAGPELRGVPAPSGDIRPT